MQMLRLFAPRIINSRPTRRVAKLSPAPGLLGTRKSRRSFANEVQNPLNDLSPQSNPAQSNLSSLNTMDIFEGETYKMNINAYSDAFFVVGEERVRGSILIFPEGYFSLHVSTIDELTIEALSVLTIKRPVTRTYQYFQSIYIVII
jgi:hypothetical protein